MHKINSHKDALLPITLRLQSLGFAGILLLALLGSILLPGPARAEMVRLGGTGAGLGTVQLLAEALQTSDPQFAFEVVPNLGSSGSLKALTAGVINIAIASRALKPQELAADLIPHLYGQTPFVLVTAKDGVAGLTLSELVDIYAGTQKTWPDGSPIRLVLRPAHDSDTTTLASFSTEMKQALDVAQARSGMIIALTDQDSATDVERLPGALGTSCLAVIQSEHRALFPLALNGVKPSIETIADGSYPYMKPLYLVTRGAPTGQAAQFMRFVLSPAGRAILNKTGHWVHDTGADANVSW